MRKLGGALALAIVSLGVIQTPASGQSAAAQRPLANTGSAAAQAPFRAGLAALHNFQYLEAAEAFQAARQADSRFALAYWGEALSHARMLWNEYDAAAGRAILGRLAPTPAARLAAAPSPLERDLIAAVDALFAEDSLRGGLHAYARRMEAIYRRRITDPDLASLYALSVLGQAQPGPAGIRARAPAIDILERTFARSPTHPGATHYLIHAYDDVEHAALGLRAAEVYAGLAPSSSHAQHMPSHIFLQLGRWDASSRSNQSAYDASVKLQRERGWPTARRDWHALLWLCYSLAQEGRFTRLDEVVRHFAQMAAETNNPSAMANYPAARAIRTLESGDWATAPTLAEAWAGAPVNEANVLIAVAMGAVHRHDSVGADSIRARMAALRAAADPTGETVPGVLQVISLMVDAFAYASRKQRDSVVAIAGRAAALERRQPLTSGIQLPIKPASEMYGEILLAFGRPHEARDQFTAVLQRIPNRPLSLWGLARAEAASGDSAGARETLTRLEDVWANADTSSLRLTRLRDFRAALGRKGAPASGPAARPPETTPPPSLLLVVNRGSHSVSVLDGTDYRLLRSIPTREGPH